MSLKEQLAEMKANLANLKERIENNEEDAIAEGLQLKADIEAKEKEIVQAEQKSALLNTIGEKDEKGEEEKMEDIKSMNLESLKAQPGTVSTYVKAYSDPEVSTTQYTYSNNIAVGGAKLGVRDAFGKEQISTNALTYYVLGDIEGTITTVAENGAKPQVHIPYTAKTAALAKVAAFIKETDELLSDNAFLESAIRNRGVYEFDKAVENYLVTTLLGTSGVQSGQSSISFDNILEAKQDIMADTGYAADTIIINPADWCTLLQSKDDNHQYLLGGPAFGPYGNGGYVGNPKVWGLDVIESAAVPQGECIVGAFKAGASVVNKAGEGMRLEVTNSDQNDFIYNRLTVRLEERLLLAVRVPAAFEIVGTEAS